MGSDVERGSRWLDVFCFATVLDKCSMYTLESAIIW